MFDLYIKTGSLSILSHLTSVASSQVLKSAHHPSKEFSCCRVQLDCGIVCWGSGLSSLIQKVHGGDLPAAPVIKVHLGLVSSDNVVIMKLSICLQKGLELILNGDLPHSSQCVCVTLLIITQTEN